MDSGPAIDRQPPNRVKQKLAALFEQACAGHHESASLAMLLAAFAVVWFIFDIVSRGPLDAHYDLSEMSIWAQHFAFGYKHPPLSGWVFGLWFSVFPRAIWAAHVLAITTVTVTLAITWRLLRDHLDFNRALLGIASLTLVPLYTFQAIKFNANLVMMPFWAGALLFYLRARRNFSALDAALAGMCLGFAFLGKYWAIYLVAGIAVASFIGASRRKFWLSPAPYVMAAAALFVVAPHLVWLLTERGSDTDSFLLTLESTDTVAANVVRSLMFLAGSMAYISAPLLFLAALRPSRAVLSDTIMPRDDNRRLALVLLLVPLVLPALANLAFSHRLTALWTFPNWALLPIVLFGSPLLSVPAISAIRGISIAAIVSVGAMIASPLIGYLQLSSDSNLHSQHWRRLAEAVTKLSSRPVHALAGDLEIIQGLPFYLSEVGSSEKTGSRAIICLRNDAACQSKAGPVTPTAWNDLTLTRRFLGFSGPTTNYRIAIAPPK